MTFRVSPGVYQRVVDLSLQPTVQSPSIAAIVGGARRGTLGPKYVTDRTKRRELYGVTDPSWGFMLDSADAYLYEGRQLWMNRVVAADARYSLGLIANNSIGGAAAGTSFTRVPAGSSVPYNLVNRDVIDIEFTGQFGAGHSATVTINGNSTSSIAFSTSHEDVMARLVQAIQTVMDGLGAGGHVAIIATGATSQLIRIIGPQATTLTVSAATVGTSKPTVATRDADWLAFVTSENPGGWGDGIAAGIANVDSGIAQKIKFSFSAALVASNVVTIIINGVTVTTTFASSNNATLTALGDAYELAFPGGTATVVDTGTANNRQIVFTAPDSETDLVVTSVGVTAGASQALVTYATTLNRKPSSGAFDFVVYENTQFRNPDESFRCTYATGVDGLGNQLGLEYAVNEGPSKSDRVRLYVNPAFSGTINGATGVTNSNNDRYLAGGDDGSLPSNSEIVTGWDAFADPEKITVRILINGGYATPEVHQAMIALGESRNDCFSVLDMPSNKQDVQDGVDYRRLEANIDSKYGAFYSPDVLIFDRELGLRRYIPPSGLVAAQYAYTDRVTHEWFAPAGLTRGLIRNALGLRVIYNEGDRDLLSTNQINAIRFFNGRYVIWGEYTAQYAMSALQSVPVVRLLITLQTQAADVVAYSLFEPHDAYTRHQVERRLTDICKPIKKARGLTDFKILCNETNNPPEVVDQRVLKASMWIKPTLSVLYIMLTAVITKQNADFDVEMTAAAGEF